MRTKLAGNSCCIVVALVAAVIGAPTPPRVLIFSLGDDYGFVSCTPTTPHLCDLACHSPTSGQSTCIRLGCEQNNVGYPHGPNLYANPEARTPTLNELALSGVRLERHYVRTTTDRFRCSPLPTVFSRLCTTRLYTRIGR